MNKKIAVIYDKFGRGIGGEPKVLLELAKGLKADVITSCVMYCDAYPEIKNLNVIRIIKNCQDKTPLIKELLGFLRLDLSQYDVVITGGRTAMVVALQKNRPKLIHYEQPPSLFNSMFYRVYKETVNLKFLLLKYFIKNIIANIDVLVANSKFVGENIQALWNVYPKVIYPPVDISKFKYKENGNFFLSVQRFTPAKRIEIQIEAFRKLPNEKLIVVGSHCDKEYFKKLRENAPENVKFLVDVPDEELVNLYATCKATIQTSKAEPFGLVPIESMASGKPCIAVNEGGFRETIIHGKTGILINKPYVDNLIETVKNFNKRTFNPQILKSRANCFSLSRFINNFKCLIRAIS